jgi:hypothetical protein
LFRSAAIGLHAPVIASALLLSLTVHCKACCNCSKANCTRVS